MHIVQEKIADPNLIAKWKKQGYENLCCLRCIQVTDWAQKLTWTRKQGSWVNTFSDPWYQLCHQLHLPCAEEQTGGGKDRGVCPLRLQRLLWLDAALALTRALRHCNFVFKLHFRICWIKNGQLPMTVLTSLHFVFGVHPLPPFKVFSFFEEAQQMNIISVAWRFWMLRKRMMLPRILPR